MKTKIIATSVVALLFLAVLFASLNFSPVTAAPPLAPTPVAVNQSYSTPMEATLINAQTLTTDTRGGCVNTSRHEKLDIHWKIDQGTTNTTTLRLQHTNDTPGVGAGYVNGQAIVSGNTADAADMQQLQAFGAWTCVFADLSTADPLSLTVKVLLR